MIEDNLKATPELSIFISEILQKSALSEDAKLMDIREVLLSTGVFMSGDGELLYRLDRTALVIELDELIDQQGPKAVVQDIIERAAS